MTTDNITIEAPASTSTTPWGFHAILDCSNVELSKIQSADNIRAWIADLLDKIEMTPIGSPIIEKTGVGMPDKEGYTAIQIIVTSSIVAHFIDRDRHIYIDVFSCKEFDTNKVLETIKTFFGTDIKVNPIFLSRNAAVTK